MSNKGAIASHCAAITATVIGWGLLVLVAIDFGKQGREGDGIGWLFLALATLGAIVCMFLAILLGTRLVALVRGSSAGTPARQTGSTDPADPATRPTATSSYPLPSAPGAPRTSTVPPTVPGKRARRDSNPPRFSTPAPETASQAVTPETGTPGPAAPETTGPTIVPGKPVRRH